jgi:hypothetical protein
MILGLALFFLIIAQTTQIHLTEGTSEQVSLFLSDVVLLDMSKYNQTVTKQETNNNLGFTNTSGEILLKSYSSTLKTKFTITNDKLTYCEIHAIDGSPIYKQNQSINYIEKVKLFLDTYQKYSQDPTISPMRDILNQVNGTQAITVTDNNIKMMILDVTNPAVAWLNSYNNVDYTSLQVSFPTVGAFFYFKDDRSYYQIGNTEIKITYDNAVHIATKQVQNYSWTIETNNSIFEVKNFTIVGTEAVLRIKTKEPFTLYPYWDVNFILDKTYPGDIVNIAVRLWADTGELIQIQPQKTTVNVQPENTPDITSTPSPYFLRSNNADGPQLLHQANDPMPIIIAAVLILTIIIIIVLIVKRNYNQKISLSESKSITCFFKSCKSSILFSTQLSNIGLCKELQR